MANKNKEIKIGVLNDPASFKIVGSVKSKGEAEFYQHEVAEPEMEKRSKPGYLINNNNHPITLSYDGEALVLAPKAKEVIANADKLGGLAKGVIFVPNEKLKN
jgi:hypothetical protein